MPTQVLAKIEPLDTKPVGRIGDDEIGLMALCEMHHVAVLSKRGLSESLGEKILVGSLRDGRLRVRSPFAASFTIDSDQIVAEAVEFNEFGFGDNRSEALLDLQRAIAELYFGLEKEQERLGPDLKRVWRALNKKIQKR